jgi:5,6,7,8-tetrahydromethanopterin hydro-lyase
VSRFRTQIGEAFAGEGPQAAHLNTVLGLRGGPVEAAWVSALATPTRGHAPFLVVLRPGLPVKPLTLFVSKAPLEGGRHAELAWGAAQAGVAQGVVDALAAGVVERSRAGELLLIAAVWVDPAASDAAAVYANNARATREALEAGRAGRPHLAEVLAGRGAVWNPFFRPGA